MFNLLRVDIASPYYDPAFADHLTEVLSAPGMAARIIDDSKIYHEEPRIKIFKIKLNENEQIIIEIVNTSILISARDNTGKQSKAFDGYILYDVTEKKLIDMITDGEAHAIYPYTAKSRIVLLDPDGDIVDYTFVKP